MSTKTDLLLWHATTYGDGRYCYVGEGSNAISCSTFVKKCLYGAGVITKEELDNQYSMWAGQGIPGFLEDKKRFKRVAWSPVNLRPGALLYSNWYHIAIWDGNNGLHEACPKTHGLATNGVSGVGHFPKHGYYNCGNGTNSWTCIYYIIEEEKPMFTQEHIDKAVKRGYEIANNNTHGYDNRVGHNLGERYGQRDYDCGAFVSDTYVTAGVLPEGTVFEPNSPTGQWGYDEILTKAGFIKHAYNAATVQKGDVLIKHGRHTELATGNGKQIGAHNNYDGVPGDGSGNEVSEVALYTNYWDYMYRLNITGEYPTVQFGSEGEAVKELQRLLNKKTSSGLVVDGSFGPVTLEEVKKYQKLFNLYVDGVVGSQTWESLLSEDKPPIVIDEFTVKAWQKAAQADGLYWDAIDGVFGPMSTKAADFGVYMGCKYRNLVVFWQKWLKNKGYYHGDIDGSFGPMTRTAVYTAQGEYRVAQDACIGPKSTKAFLKI